MNGYAGTLHELAEGYGISVRQTPPARAGELHDYLTQRIAQVNQALPEGVLPRDQELLRALTFGLLAQDTGWSNRPDVHVAKVEEQRLTELERRGLCDAQASTLQRITATDRQRVAVLTPSVLAELFWQLVEEVEHAELTHLHDIEPHLYHCPSLQPEARAVKNIQVVLPIALQILVGDDPQQAAMWILCGETPSRYITR